MFSPYHTFTGCSRLQKEIARLTAAGAIAAPMGQYHDIYHYSLLHKLRSAKYHVDTLKSYLSTQNPSVPATELVYRVNFHFDGFLHTLGSGADIFAREILSYFNIPHPQNVYFHTAEQQIALARPGDAVLPFIQSPPWRALFSEYRNTATHENLIGTGYSIQIDIQGGKQIQRLQFPIPDDPRVWPRTYDHHPDIVEYCRITYRRWLSLFNQTYLHLVTRTAATNTLPL